MIRLERDQRKVLPYRIDDLIEAHDLLEVPIVSRADVHIFNEAKDVSAAAKVARQVDNRMIVDTLLYDAVDLEMGKASGFSRRDPLEDLCGGQLVAVHLAKHRVVQTVEADSEPPQASLAQLVRHAGQERRVGCECCVRNAFDG